MTREINAGERDPTAPRQEWQTPRALARLIVARWSIDLDAMARAENAIVPRFIQPGGVLLGGPTGAVANDALTCRWALWGSSIFCNPPFAVLAKAAGCAIQAAQMGAQMVFLAPDNGDTRWYAALVDAGAVVLRFRGRVAYEPSGAVEAKRGAAFPSALYVMQAFSRPRVKGEAVPTFAVDPRTLEVL